MAEWTGVMYSFYSNKNEGDVMPLFCEFMQELAFKCKKTTFKTDKFWFFYKNAEMIHMHNECGYNLNMNGEGCFSIEAKRTKLHGMANLFEFEGEKNFEPYDINLRMDDVFYYMLLLPSEIDKSIFCRSIYEKFNCTIMAE